MTPWSLAGFLGAPPTPTGSWEREAVYASAVALRGSARGGEPGAAPTGSPCAVAEDVAARLRGCPGVASVRVRPDGFLLITVSTPGDLIREIVTPAGAEAPDGAFPRASSSGRATGGGLNSRSATHHAGPVELSWPDFPRTWDNPGFVIRYAHVRAVAVQRWARELGVPGDELRPELLTDARDRAVLRLLAELPSRTASRQPRWPTYLERLATAYHDAHEQAPALPMGDGPVEALHTARLWLAEAVRIVLDDLTAGVLPTRL